MRSDDEIVADITIAQRAGDMDALLRLAVELDERGDAKSSGDAAQLRGQVHQHNSELSASLEQYRQAIDKYEQHGDRRSMAVAVISIGNVHHAAGDYPSALENYRRALAVYEELGNRAGAASVTMGIGMVYSSTGDYPSALEYLHRALALYEELNKSDGIAGTTVNIGVVYARTGDQMMALEHFRRALAMQEEFGNRNGAGIIVGNMGNVYYASGDYSSALEHSRRALAEYEELGDRAGVALVTGNMVSVLLKLDRLNEAEDLLLHQAAMHMGSPDVRSQHKANYAALAERKSDLEAARHYLLEALSISTEAGLRADTGEYHLKLRDLAQQRNDFAGYIEHNNEYQRITEEVRGKDTTQRLAMMEAERRAAAVEHERLRERALLYGALPESVAKRLLRGEKVSGDHYENAGVIFLDIVGFTSLSDKIPPGHVVHLLSQIFSALDEVCKRNGVTKIKTIGDSYMAVSFANTEHQTPKTNSLVPNNEHVVNAGLCAVEMLSALNALEIAMPPEMGDTSWTKEVGDIQVRIGMHCGPVTAGVIGTERMQYDVWGDTVNVASRMESSGEPRRIHVSEAFATALQSENGEQRTENNPSPHPPIPLSLRQRGTIDIKGKGPMTTYWLEGT